MNPKLSGIKKHFPKLMMTVAMLLSFLPASAYDFEADGIYFNITDAAKHEVAVTYKEYYGRTYSGDINIPSKVTNGGTTYTVTSIGRYAFSKCSGLTSVTIPNSVNAIGEKTFWACRDLTSITIPNSVTSIGKSAFSGCSGLTSISIPNSVTSIGERAFESCNGLTGVTIPNSVTSIGGSAFNWCRGLVAINVDPGNKFYASVEGVLYNKNLTEIVRYPEGKPGTTFSIPSSVTSIGSSAFYCLGLTNVTIPNSVTSIGDFAFIYCTYLTSVTIPNSVTSIGAQAFQDCTGLTSVTIGNSVTSIGGEAFRGCWSLTSVTIGNSVTSIEGSVFNECYALGAINVNPGNKFYASVDGVLYNKTLTEIIRYPAGKPETTFSIPSSMTSIGERAFIGCN